MGSQQEQHGHEPAQDRDERDEQIAGPHACTTIGCVMGFLIVFAYTAPFVAIALGASIGVAALLMIAPFALGAYLA